MKKTLMVLLGLFLLTALAACGSQTETESGMKLVEEGKFTFAASGEFKPFSWTLEDGTMTGFDIEVGEAIAKEIGLEPVQKKHKFNAIVEGVKSGRFDAAVASHTITPDRQEHVDFSTPYYYSGAQIFTQPGSNLETLEDLEGKTVGVSKGSTYMDYAEEVTDDIKVYDSDVVALQVLSEGKLDAVITDFLTGKEGISNGLEIVGKTMLDRSEQAVAVAKDNPELLEQVNEALEILRENGTLKELSEKYFDADITTKPE
ncbi:amino acid ABC transporter substrate-binding protein (PAAT family) [Melghiribacillus thermohalophilus]|uniref:Amino acid ABC transporter substrate-binding protein (PAAT family) n=1 Tax=Melghiribacillus thermohalophilus TaxID=1324956 RepID=A0A4R3NDS3_9BACI|nr:transporter substrate-binding domain-containing protein [Melghiribacillus thermohalophilus]TCT27153.1 amino acid ABC transporter substrate-binding protein (PAAT family) [Melghiribacillus thermohalophilus]